MTTWKNFSKIAMKRGLSIEKEIKRLIKSNKKSEGFQIQICIYCHPLKTRVVLILLIRVLSQKKFNVPCVQGTMMKIDVCFKVVAKRQFIIKLERDLPENLIKAKNLNPRLASQGFKETSPICLIVLTKN